MFSEDVIQQIKQIQEKYEAEISRVLSKIPEAGREHITFSGFEQDSGGREGTYYLFRFTRKTVILTRGSSRDRFSQ
jgi:hypothetical protein